MSTIKDIAKHVGVSVATVSNALNGRTNVSDDMRARISQAAKELNYVPNINAKLMKARDTNNIGLFLPYLRASFYISLIQEIFTHVNRAGYSLLIHVSRDIDSRLLLANMLSCNIDAAIVLSDRFPDESIPMLHSRGVPVVFLDREVQLPLISSVVINNEMGVRQALEYLATTGHKSVSHLYGLPNYDGSTRLDAFYKHAKALNMTVDEEWTMCCHFNQYAAYSAMRAKLAMSSRHIPDAFLCADNETATGCIRALRDEGFEVPRDASVVGFVHSEGAPAEAGGISSTQYYMRDFAREAVSLLTNMLDGGSGGEARKVDTRFVVGSTVNMRI